MPFSNNNDKSGNMNHKWIKDKAKWAVDAGA